MYIAVLAAIVIGFKVTMTFGEGRQLPNDYSQVDRVNSALQNDIDAINKLPVLPKLESSWRIASATSAIYGVAFKALDEMTKGEQTNSYSGPLRNWTAQLSGEPRAVLGVAKKIQSEVPTFLYDYTISGGIMKLNITVVGT
ncbi:hypothetical protein H8F21_15475 [Pseudomonas sp. P66]|uniref:Uncharacterized protein n=1 Tax=Pseudomonas arcuscaelestis TaxID=2710591 RepID=A0ABS2BZB4_9PSED|nr:hypothetical protein [Pseudomonas arcuscaelestis]MBM5458967.1 hypothetical protein [Pseudomonas arcuscaelestis]